MSNTTNWETLVAPLGLCQSLQEKHFATKNEPLFYWWGFDSTVERFIVVTSKEMDALVRELPTGKEPRFHPAYTAIEILRELPYGTSVYCDRESKWVCSPPIRYFKDNYTGLTMAEVVAQFALALTEMEDV